MNRIPRPATMTSSPPISLDTLRIDAAAETERIVAGIRRVVLQQWNRKGAVICLSGGIDSSVVAYLCTRALGKGCVVALIMPEIDSSPKDLRLARKVADVLKLRVEQQDISPILRAVRYYQRREQVVRNAMPGYRSGSSCHIVPPGALHTPNAALFSVMVESPEGRATWVSLTSEAYQDIVAATNFKQRTRKMIEYYYADLLEYAVLGTSNRLKYDQGLFVKNGDGAADLEPIAHLYQSQVCQLARYLRVPADIWRRPPSIDSYPLEQIEDDRFLLLPLEEMDLCLYGQNNGIPASEVAPAVGLEPHQVQQVYNVIQAKRAAAEYLRAAPVMVPETKEA